MKGGNQWPPVSYQEALTPTERVNMHEFLLQLSNVSAKAMEQGLEKPDVDHFIKAYREINGRAKDITKSKRNRLARNAKGLCSYCAKPVVPGLNVCAEHRQKRNDYAKAHKGS